MKQTALDILNKHSIFLDEQTPRLTGAVLAAMREIAELSYQAGYELTNGDVATIECPEQKEFLKQLFPEK